MVCSEVDQMAKRVELKVAHMTNDFINGLSEDEFARSYQGKL